MNSLPLSWSIVTDKDSGTNLITNWKIHWPAIKNLSNTDFNVFADDFIDSENDTLIRGCNKSLKLKLEKKGFSSLHVGYEAILDLTQNPFDKKSIVDLVKRGKRNGNVITLPYSELVKDKLHHFQQLCSHGSEPQLQNLFQMEFTPNHFLNVFCDHNSNWQGAILISKNSKIKLHTELLLRKKNAPVGVMETLVEYSFLQAKSSEYKFLSLGEVPFAKSFKRNNNFLSSIVFKMGGFLNFAYNHNGLYNFKNKFNPNWTEIYICASKKVGIKHLFFLFINSNFHKLLIHKIFHKFLSKIHFFSLIKKNNIFTT